MNLGDNVQEEILGSKGVRLHKSKRIYIKCPPNLPQKAFTNFTKRYLERIEPFWITEGGRIDRGSLCIVVCFHFSRLQDNIEAVIRDTPHGKLSV